LKSDYCPITIRQKSRIVPVIEFSEIQRQVKRRRRDGGNGAGAQRRCRAQTEASR